MYLYDLEDDTEGTLQIDTFKPHRTPPLIFRHLHSLLLPYYQSLRLQ
jgi:hypothetical protein